jgi:hypothetical protein
MRVAGSPAWNPHATFADVTTSSSASSSPSRQRPEGLADVGVQVDERSMARDSGPGRHVVKASDFHVIESREARSEYSLETQWSRR